MEFKKCRKNINNINYFNDRSIYICLEGEDIRHVILTAMKLYQKICWLSLKTQQDIIKLVPKIIIGPMYSYILM